MSQENGPRKIPHQRLYRHHSGSGNHRSSHTENRCSLPGFPQAFSFLIPGFRLRESSGGGCPTFLVHYSCESISGPGLFSGPFLVHCRNFSGLLRDPVLLGSHPVFKLFQVFIGGKIFRSYSSFTRRSRISRLFWTCSRQTFHFCAHRFQCNASRLPLIATRMLQFAPPKVIQPGVLPTTFYAVGQRGPRDKTQREDDDCLSGPWSSANFNNRKRTRNRSSHKRRSEKTDLSQQNKKRR